jgi:fimbrial chaperone protein
MRLAVILAASCVLWPACAGAFSVRVAPVMLDMTAPASATKLTLRNDNRQISQVQLRVFRWIQEPAGERLVPTTDVVVSPPMISLSPGTEYVARVVRVSKLPVQFEESYRLLVDELPDPAERRPGVVSLIVRQSIPVFFARPDGVSANVAWSVKREAGSYLVTATNSGSRRLRISSLKLTNRQGAALAQTPGLVGYVLGGSQMTWSFPARHRDAGADLVKLTAETEAEPVDVSTKLQSSH